ncbi:MAG: C40 family peptidase [Treponema sp.]|nr:C40 family peptidase [Treponema sp.]
MKKLAVIFLSMFIGMIAFADETRLSAARMNFTNYVTTLKGIKFRLNGAKPETGFGAAGLVKYAAKESVGTDFPNDVQKIYTATERIKREELIPGDLVFFRVSKNSPISNIGVYLGVSEMEGKLKGKEVFIYAASRGNNPKVSIISLDDAVMSRQYCGAGRFLPVKDETTEKPIEDEVDIFADYKPASSDFENVDKEINTSELEKGILDNFTLMKEQAVQLEKDLLEKTEALAGGKSAFASANKNKKSDLLSQALSAMKKGLGLVETPKSASKANPKSSAISCIPVEQASDARQTLIKYSMGLRGCPYVYGATGPSTFDCSGFVQYSAKHGLDMQLPRTAAEQYKFVQKISDGEREPGDLVFFSYNGKVSHVGIYLGKYNGSGRLAGRYVFLNAASAGPSTGVTLSALDEPTWKKTYKGAGRILPSTATSGQLSFAAANIIDE